MISLRKKKLEMLYCSWKNSHTACHFPHFNTCINNEYPLKFSPHSSLSENYRVSQVTDNFSLPQKRKLAQFTRPVTYELLAHSLIFPEINIHTQQTILVSGNRKSSCSLFHPPRFRFLPHRPPFRSTTKHRHDHKRTTWANFSDLLRKIPLREDPEEK